MLGPGPFVSALEFASGKKAEVVGKPESTFFNSVLKEIGFDATEVVMIGDVSTSILAPGLITCYKARVINFISALW